MLKKIYLFFYLFCVVTKSDNKITIKIVFSYV